MKALILALTMTIGAAATAWTTDYGPNSYTKTVRVCGYAKNGGPGDCRNMTYRYYAPRVEKVCYNLGKDGNGSMQKCYNRLTTGNWGSRKFSSREEAREQWAKERRNEVP